ncbi:MAG: hypothetical protein CMK56_03985, partial [Proteobacteria bacterium]|nr:hypothetical protein [Pseudomonadota bacterium]
KIKKKNYIDLLLLKFRLFFSKFINTSLNSFFSLNTVLKLKVPNYLLPSAYKSLKKNFPNRKINFTFKDYLHLIQHFKPELIELFKYYDIIHCYGTDVIQPLIHNCFKYVCYEHGTLRSIPFQNNFYGKLVLNSYCMTKHLFITNSDTVKNVKKVKCKSHSFIPHPINEKWKLDKNIKKLKTTLLKNLNHDFILFHPPRHHWEDMKTIDESYDKSWLKGNDIFFNGVKNFIKKTDANPIIITVEWGQKVNESKKLIEHLGIERNVKWIQPQSIFMMTKYFSISDIIIDQFILGAFGSITAKALFHGKPIMTYVDEKSLNGFFKTIPPVINVENSKQITSLLNKFYKNRKLLEDIGYLGKKWYEKNHSNKVILEKLYLVYNNI